MKVYKNLIIYAIVAVFSIFILYLPYAIFALPDQKMLHPDDWAYEAISILSREQGEIFFTDSRITSAQMLNYLDTIDEYSLSESGFAIYDKLYNYLNSTPVFNFQSDYVDISMDLLLQPEMYYKSNENISWIYNEHSRNALLTIPFGFSLGPWFTAEMDFYLGENEYAATLHNNYSNIPSDGGHIDLHTPKRAYISAGIPFGKASGIHLTLGTGDNFFGQTQTGSIIMSEYLQRVSYAQASIYSPAFKYTAQVMQYEVNKYQYMHYFQLRPHRSVSLSIAEGVMVNAPLELRYLNPFMIFHSFESYKTYRDYNDDLGYDRNDDIIYESQTNNSRVGSYLGFKLEWQPVKNLRLYGLFVMTQLQISYEKKNWPELLTPDALGFQAGINLSFPLNNGYLDFGIEGVYTYPYLYVLHNEKWSFFKEAHEVDNMTLRYWTGTPFGPDTIAGAFKAGFRSSANWYIGFSFIYSAQGDRSSLDIFNDKVNHSYRPTPVVFDVTVPPTGIPLYTYTTVLEGEYYFRDWLSFNAQTGYRVMKRNDLKEQGFELTLSVRFKPDLEIWSNS